MASVSQLNLSSREHEQEMTVMSPRMTYRERGGDKMDAMIELLEKIAASEADYKQHEDHQKKKHKPRLPRKEWHYKLFKTPKETSEAIAAAGEKKAKVPLDRLIVLGMLSGFFIAFGGIFSIVVSGGMPHEDPGLSKLLLGLTFPVGLAFIIFFGGELFTGNTMYMTTAFCSRKVTIKGVLYSWFVSYFANFAGCALGAYLFGYVTDLFILDPWNAKVKAITMFKVSMEFEVVFFRAVAANWIVNLTIFTAISSEDIGGKLFAIFTMICAFAASGFEHCIANMFFVTLGLMYGADTTFGEFIKKNLIPATLGNMVGGGICVGLVCWYVYIWRPNAHERPNEIFVPTCCIPSREDEMLA